jgi:hypothetical protein
MSENNDLPWDKIQRHRKRGPYNPHYACGHWDHDDNEDLKDYEYGLKWVDNGRFIPEAEARELSEMKEDHPRMCKAWDKLSQDFANAMEENAQLKERIKELENKI